MLDLNIKENYYEVRTAEGDELKIKFPSQKFLKKLTSITDKGEDVADNIESIYDCMYHILNANINGKKYSREYVADLGFQVCVMVVKDYVETVFTNWEE